jgi:hypothetical protein
MVPHSYGTWGTVVSSKTFVSIYQTARFYNPEYRTVRLYHSVHPSVTTFLNVWDIPHNHINPVLLQGESNKNVLKSICLGEARITNTYSKRIRCIIKKEKIWKSYMSRNRFEPDPWLMMGIMVIKMPSLCIAVSWVVDFLKCCLFISATSDIVLTPQITQVFHIEINSVYISNSHLLV